MIIDEYLKKHNFKLYPWAKSKGISPEIITMYRKGRRGLSLETVAKIVAATGGEVTYEDLVAEMTERRADRRAADKPDNGGEAVEIPPGI